MKSTYQLLKWAIRDGTVDTNMLFASCNKVPVKFESSVSSFAFSCGQCYAYVIMITL